MTSRKLNPTEKTFNQPRPEILQVADIVAREKGIDPAEVFTAMEYAIEKAAKTKYGQDHHIEVSIDRSNGQTIINRCLTVVKEVEDSDKEITVDGAKEFGDGYKVGDVIKEELPPVEFGRVAAQGARQVIMGRVRDAERTKQYEEYKDKIGDIVSGIVKSIEFGHVVVDINGTETLIHKSQQIPREHFRVGERTRAIVSEIRPDYRGPIVHLSSTHPEFLIKLFEQEGPEIYEGVIQIVSAARDPGSRAKIAVFSKDTTLDPVGACVGMRGSRVQAVVSELQGEKIDIVLYNEDLGTFIVNALAPAEITSVVLDEDTNKVDVIVKEDQLSLAIGRRGQNVRLASELTSCKLDIVAESEDAERRKKESEELMVLFTSALDIDEMVAQLLLSEGFSRIEEVAYIDSDELLNIEGFESDLVDELQNRARTYLEERNIKAKEAAKGLGVAEDLINLDVLNGDQLLRLAKKDIKTMDDLGDLAGDELLEILGSDTLDEDSANAIIMKARESWFSEDQE